MESSERTRSVWATSDGAGAYPKLDGRTDTDVCVVGAGLAGLTTAYLLSKSGRRVVVLDDNDAGGGETGQTTAHLASANDDYFHVLERIHGAAVARLVHQSHRAAIEEIGRIVDEEHIACDYERLDGYWIPAAGTQSDLLPRELAAAERAGAEVAMVARVPGMPFEDGPALCFRHQGQFHPIKYLRALSTCIRRDGGSIHTGNHVTAIDGGPSPRASGEGFEVRAQAIAVCTNTPIVDRFAIHTKQAPYRTFAIAARVPRGALPHVLLWDTENPYHYVRLAGVEGDDSSELLIVGGEDHKTGEFDDATSRFRALERWARTRFPMIREIVHRWSGQVMEPVDHLAFIGRDPGHRDNVYIATGDSGQGMTHGTIAGMIIRDQVLGRPNPWEEVYEPTRKSLSAAAVREWIAENANVVRQYIELVPGVHTTADSPDEIARGSGAIIQRGGRKVAVHRTDEGALIERSAFCTHLGCVVHWNSLERSWDCPCHGSRFAPTGEVLNGPAVSPLSQLE